MDVTAVYTHETSTASVGGLELSNTQTTLVALTLPRPAPIRASFVREGLAAQLVKLFKRELQTGDATFDQAVYITTDTADATSAWLADAGIRARVLELVESGGSIEIEGTKVRARIGGGHTRDEDPTLMRVVEALLDQGSR